MPLLLVRIARRCYHFGESVSIEVTLIRTQIQLTERQAADLKAYAAQAGLSIAEVIRRSIDRTLQAEWVSDEERKRRALSIIGKFSGPPELGAEHDRYLTEHGRF